uniref:Uncharacterized protein n=1 Tax=Acrobeloides nanus TaxID=290746 RepID=A0A914C9I3_9BILA
VFDGGEPFDGYIKNVTLEPEDFKVESLFDILDTFQMSYEEDYNYKYQVNTRVYKKKRANGWFMRVYLRPANFLGSYIEFKICKEEELESDNFE